MITKYFITNYTTEHGSDQLHLSTIFRSTQGMFSWTIRGVDDNGEPKIYGYRTNSAGEGLWIEGAVAADDRQIRGTGDFRVGGDARQVRRQVISEFIN